MCVLSCLVLFFQFSTISSFSAFTCTLFHDQPPSMVSLLVCPPPPRLLLILIIISSHPSEITPEDCQALDEKEAEFGQARSSGTSHLPLSLSPLFTTSPPISQAASKRPPPTSRPGMRLTFPNCSSISSTRLFTTSPESPPVYQGGSKRPPPMSPPGKHLILPNHSSDISSHRLCSREQASQQEALPYCDHPTQPDSNPTTPRPDFLSEVHTSDVTDLTSDVAYDAYLFPSS